MAFSALERPSPSPPRFIPFRIFHLAIFNEIFLTSSVVLWSMCQTRGRTHLLLETPRRGFVICASHRNLVCIFVLLLLSGQLLGTDVTARVLLAGVYPSGAAVPNATVLL